MASAADSQTPAADAQLVLRRKPLDAVMFAVWRGAEIEVALAALKRIRAYWNATTSYRWCAIVPEDDQGLYQTLTHDLFFALGQRPELGVLTAEIRKQIPEQPVDHDLALALDDEIKGDIFDGLSRARFMLNEVLIAEGGSFGQNRADPLFALFDKELEMIARDGKRQVDEWAIKLRLKNSNQTQQPPNVAKRCTKPGRHQQRARDRRTRAVALTSAGKTRKEVAHELGVTERYVYHLLANQSGNQHPS